MDFADFTSTNLTSLIFFSSIPSSYYYLLTQAHYLARDTLHSLSTSDCTGSLCVDFNGSVMDGIVFGDRDAMNNTIVNSVGVSIPPQFGYVMELSNDSGKSWSVLYDTGHPDSDDHQNHTKSSKRLSVSSQVIVFDYSAKITKDSPNPFFYWSCNGGGGGSAELLTCSNLPKNDYGAGGGALDLVPSTGIRLVRLTIFI